MTHLRARTPLVVLVALAGIAAAQSHRISGGLAHSPATFGGDVREAFFSPDGSRLLYAADQDLAGRVDLYSTSADGSSTPVLLSAPEEPQDRVFGPVFTPDGSRGSWLVYRTTTDLYGVPVDGSRPAARLNGRFGPGSPPPFMVGPSYRISPNGTRVVYLADANVDQRYELFSVPIDGNARGSARLNGPLIPAGDVREFELSPDGARVIYLADQELDERLELFSVPTGDGRLLHGSLGARRSQVKLNGPLAPGESVTFTFSLVGGAQEAPFRISPDGRRVVFVAAVIDGFVYHELFGADIAGGGLVQLTSGNSYVESLHFDPTGERVVFGATSSVEVDGSEPALLLCSSNLPAAPISPDGEWVVCTAVLEQGGRRDLYAVPIDGSQAPLRISGPCIEDGDVVAISNTTPALFITSDSEHVVFRADQDEDEVFELYAAALPGLP